MPAERKCLYLHDMTWPEVKAALPEIKLAIIPVGSTEQHGPHATFEMDTAGSREFSKLLGERLYPHALVAPPVPVGISSHHMHFPATMTLRPETLIAVLMDMVNSLRAHGIKRFFFANGHGGNTPVLTIVNNRIKHELGCMSAVATVPYAAVHDVWEEHVKTQPNGHSCDGEVSIMMHLYPQAIRKDALTPGKIVKATQERINKWPWVSEARFFDESTENGALGDATKATPEIGKALVEAGLDRIAAYLRDFMER
ncbi:MAG: creatininase family protein [Bacillota bacterium]